MQKTSDYQRLLYACTQEGCSLCRIAQENTHRYLDAWQYDLFTDVEIREELRRTQGFCHDHTWQLVRMGASLQLAQAYRDILSDAVEQLQGSTEVPVPQSGGLLRRFFEAKRERPPCPACRQREQAEIRLVNMLRKALLDPAFYQQFAASQGLCLDHFRLACELKMPDTPGEWLPLLRQGQLACLQRLDAQLGELIRKHDYRFKDEAQGPEMVSWKRAAGLVAGEKFEDDF
jgi:Family of unknown function (DUF6062)